VDKLPLSGDLRRTIVSDEMKQMALHYKTGLLSIKPNRRFAKGALQRFAFRLQWMLENKCAGAAMLLAKVINFAFASPTLRGAYQLRCTSAGRCVFSDDTALGQTSTKMARHRSGTQARTRSRGRQKTYRKKQPISRLSRFAAP
jgi:hypothetical protein